MRWSIGRVTSTVRIPARRGPDPGGCQRDSRLSVTRGRECDSVPGPQLRQSLMHDDRCAAARVSEGTSCSSPFRGAVRRPVPTSGRGEANSARPWPMSLLENGFACRTVPKRDSTSPCSWTSTDVMASTWRILVSFFGVGTSVTSTSPQLTVLSRASVMSIHSFSAVAPAMAETG